MCQILAKIELGSGRIEDALEALNERRVMLLSRLDRSVTEEQLHRAEVLAFLEQGHGPPF